MLSGRGRTFDLGFLVMTYVSDSSGVSFGYDKDGLTFRKNAPVDCILCPVEAEIAYAMIGCYSLSGLHGPLEVVWSDGEREEKRIICNVLGRFVTLRYQFGLGSIICVPICKMPRSLSETCRKIGDRLEYACPLVDGLSAFGVLVSRFGIRNRILEWPNRSVIDLPCREFDKNLDGDGYGRMADLVSKGMSVLNQMMISPNSYFYDRVLSGENMDGGVYIIRRSEAKMVFKIEPIHIREYVASTVPVEMENNDDFKRITGCTSEKVNVMVSSSMNTGMSDFLRFMKIVSGRGWVCSCSPESFVFKKSIPTFRHHGAYNTTEDVYKEIMNA